MTGKPESPEGTAARILPCSMQCDRPGDVTYTRMDSSDDHWGGCASQFRSQVAEAIRAAVEAERERLITHFDQLSADARRNHCYQFARSYAQAADEIRATRGEDEATK